MVFLLIWWLAWMSYTFTENKSKKLITPETVEWKEYQNQIDEDSSMRFDSWWEYIGSEESQVSLPYTATLSFLIWLLWFVFFSFLMLNSNHDNITNAMLIMNAVPTLISTYWTVPYIIVNRVEN